MKFLKHAGQLAKVLGAFGSFLTVILGVIHVFVSSLSLRTRYYPVVEPQRCLLALCSCSSALQTIGASIRWPRGREYEVFDDGKFYKFKESFMADQQRYGWRGELFSLTPGKAHTSVSRAIAVDVWPPLIIGTIGLSAHRRNARKLRFITRDFSNYFIFNMFQGLFATIAYEGALGIIFSIPVFLSAAFCLLMLLFDDDDASLGLKFDWLKNADKRSSNTDEADAAAHQA